MKTQRYLIPGAAGAIEVALDVPDAARGLAVVAHPHPLRGGSMDNKVATTLAKAAVECGLAAVRFNFRGVGQSEGLHDHGVGESDDVLQVISAARGATALQALVLMGFSFGTYVQSRALDRHANALDPRAIVFAGTAAGRALIDDNVEYATPPLPTQMRDRCLLVHGELDEVIPLSNVLTWAAPQRLAVSVLPQCTHFFHGQLDRLKHVTRQHLTATLLTT